MASIQSLVPRASLTLHSKQLRQRLFIPSPRHASTKSPPKPRVLEKPERFNPPSHPSRLRYKPKYHGPPLSDRERQAQQTRRYPHMMPPEGSFMYWFLTNRYVHAIITMTILFGLVFAMWISDFVYNTPYRDILPPNSMFFSHPFAFLARYWEVYEMHVAYTSSQTQERRKRKVEDVRKRSEYRKAHGLDKDEGLFGGWTARTDAETMGPAMKEGGVPALPGPNSTKELAKATVENIEGKAEEDVFVDFEGNKQHVKKRWFGIW